MNLFVNGAGRYVAPVTSRTRFRSRGANTTEVVKVTLRVPDAPEIAWVHAISADGPSYRGTISSGPGGAAVAQVSKHGTATMVVAGKGAEPPLDSRH